MEGINAFVTGCGRGLGASLARGLHARGARVFAGYQPGDVGFAAPLVPADRLVPVPIDVSDTASVTAAAALVAQQARRVDLLLNVAGVLGNMTTTVPGVFDEADIHRTFDVNAVGPVRVTNAFYPLLLAGLHRLVINISSESGSVATIQRREWYGYCMSKSALNMASALLHNTLQPLGGRVIVIHPGWVRTWMQGRLDTSGKLFPDESAEAILVQVDRALADSALFGGERVSFIDWKGDPMEW